MFIEKINVLVPNAKCSTSGEKIVDWFDERPQPTEEAIRAVTDEQVRALVADKEATNCLIATKKDRLLFEINFDQENRIRALSGQPVVTREQYRTALINRYKSL